MKVQIDICKDDIQANGDIDTCQLYSEVEDWDSCDTVSDVYKAAVREYGRPRSKVYLDINDKTHQVGWTFEKHVKYQDCNRTFLQTTWVCPLKSHVVKIIIEYAME